MTEQELINSLKELKNINPSKPWAFSLKMQILEQKNAPLPVQHRVLNMLGSIFNTGYHNKLAYAFAAFLLVAMGFVGVLGTGSLPFADKSVAVLSPDFVIKSRVETLKEKSEYLTSAVKSNQPETILVAVKEVKDAAKKLTDSIAQNPSKAKEVALDMKNNKTYFDISAGFEVKQASDELYKIIDEQMIRDLEQTTLTEEQKISFDEAKGLFEQEEYAQALEKILTISN